jgi:hypothetical protein
MCLWLKRLESARFKTSPDLTYEDIVLSVQELIGLRDGFDLWRNRPYQVLTPRFEAIFRGMISMPHQPPDDPAVLKQLIAQMQSKVAHLEEQPALLRQRLFGCKSEQAVDRATPQLALFQRGRKSLCSRC